MNKIREKVNDFVQGDWEALIILLAIPVIAILYIAAFVYGFGAVKTLLDSVPYPYNKIIGIALWIIFFGLWFIHSKLSSIEKELKKLNKE